MDYYDVLTANEKAFLDHVSMFGSSGYPVARLLSTAKWAYPSWGLLGAAKWVWYPAWGTVIPMAYKTRKAAFAAVEAYHSSLLARVGDRAKELASGEIFSK